MSASTAQHHGSAGMLASRRFTWCWAALALASLSLSLIAACLPVGFSFHYTSERVEPYLPTYVKAEIVESRAYAVAEPVEGALSFIDECAAAAGMTSSQFVAAVCGSVTVATGMVVGYEAGIEMGNTLPQNLSNLVDAADYPSWDTLDSTTQTAWKSKENYDAAKFNSLLSGLGYGSVAAEYYDSYTPSGGGNFDPGQDLLDKLKQIGRIGNRWALGLGNTFESVATLVSDREAVEQYFGVQQPSFGFNAAGVSGWPSGWPTYLEFGNGSVAVIKTATASDGFVYLGVWATDSPVWILCLRNQYGGSWWTYRTWCVSYSPFAFGAARGEYKDPSVPTVTPTGQATHRTNNSADYYYAGYSFEMGNIITESTFPVNEAPNSNTFNVLDSVMARGGPISSGTSGPTLEDYPEIAPDPDEMVYYPSEGNTTNNTWNSYTTPTPVNQPENPFNPGNETGKDEWKDKTEASTVNLEGVHFEKLFPFCLLADIGLLFNKMQSLGILPQMNQAIGENGDLSTQGAVIDNASAYLHVKLPISSFDPGHEFIQDGEEVDFDLIPLHDLLIMVRPAVQILVVVVLLFTLIDFWRGVLAG